MLTHTHKTVICSSSPQYIRHCNRPHDDRSNDSIHHVQCDGTCVFLSPGPKQPRQPHVHLCGYKQPPEPLRKHQALQQKSKTFLSFVFNFATSSHHYVWSLDFFENLFMLLRAALFQLPQNRAYISLLFRSFWMPIYVFRVGTFVYL